MRREGRFGTIDLGSAGLRPRRQGSTGQAGRLEECVAKWVKSAIMVFVVVFSGFRWGFNGFLLGVLMVLDQTGSSFWGMSQPSYCSLF